MAKHYITRLFVCLYLLSGCSPVNSSSTGTPTTRPLPPPVTQPTTTHSNSAPKIIFPDNIQYRLNTYTWDYAPWFNEFQKALLKNWSTPYAYNQGIISGIVELQITVEKDGTISKIETISSTGHQSLTTASIRALELTSSCSPLPELFTEDNLVITLTLQYPPIKK